MRISQGKFWDNLWESRGKRGVNPSEASSMKQNGRKIGDLR